MELLTLHRDVIAQRICCGLRISCLQRTYNLFMFGHGLPHPPPEPQLLTAKRLQTLVQFRSLLREKAVAGLLIDDSVKALVFRIIGIHIARSDRLLAMLVCITQLCQRGIGNPQRRKPPADGLQLCHDLKHFQQLNRARLTDKCTTSRDEFQQSR